MNSLLSALVAALLSLFGLHPPITHVPPISAPPIAGYDRQSASLAAAAASFGGAPSSGAQPETSPTSIASSSTQPTIERIIEYDPLPSDDFVTEGELQSQLDLVTNNLTSLINAAGSSSRNAVPQSVAADGNSVYPYAAENSIDNLSNVTISNANISASEIPALNYLSLSGGTLSGTLNLPSINASSTNYGIITATDSSTTDATSTNLFANVASFGSLSGAAFSALTANYLPVWSAGTWTDTPIFNNAGNIGIGTTTPWSDIASTPALLDLTTNGIVRIVLHDAATGQEEKLSSDGTGFYIDSAGAASASNNNIVFRVSDANSSYTTFEAGRFTSAGLFGVGTTSPWAQISASSTSITPTLAVQQNSTGPSALFLGGNVGIGTTSPDQALAVNGSVDIAGTGAYMQGDQTILYASTTDNTLAVGASAAAAWMSAPSAPSFNIAIGASALATDTTGSTNVAIGADALANDTTGNNNLALGVNALYSNTTGIKNTALGRSPLFDNTTGGGNIAVGYGALQFNLSATNTVAVGYGAGQGSSAYYNQGGTYIGYQSGLKVATSSDYNTFLGYQSGFDVTGGNDNILIGPELNTGGNHLATGQGDICIGYNCILPAGTAANNQLNIGNVIFGTNLTATSSGTSIPGSLTGDIGIGTAKPYSPLQVNGPDTASTSAFAVVNSASTTVFSVFDNGNSTYSGSIYQSSDERLKTDVQSLNASSSLAFIGQLNPVSYFRIDQPGTGENLGFIAQQVQQIFPQLVSTTSPTALTADGTLTLNYEGLISPIVSAIQGLSAEVSSLENTIAGFAQSFTTNELTFNRATGDEIDANQICLTASSGTPVCLTGDQLAAMLASTEVSASTQEENASSSGNVSVSSASSSPTTPPQIQVNGDNPAYVQVGAIYSDLGATITGPEQDLNLGIETFVNGMPMSPVLIDTSQPATDTVVYVATDQNGLTSTSTRTIIVEATSTSL